MVTLPDAPGRYQVGATTFAIPVLNPVPVGSTKLKSTGGNTSNDHALLLEEVAFTAYYPVAAYDDAKSYGASPSDLSNRPVKRTLHGYAHVGGIPYWFTRIFSHYAARLKIPVRTNAPLLDPAQSPDEKRSWPLVIFSHGLGGSRTNYSQICSRIAAEGNVVLAVEHRDGTGPAVSIANGQGSGHSPQFKLYLRPEDDGSEPKSFALRLDQLQFRRLEIYLIYKYFSEFINTRIQEDIDGPQKQASEGAFWKSWLSDQFPKVQYTENLSLVGHSFGGATILSILSNPPLQMPGSDARFDALPITHALVLDPWLEPFPSPGPNPHLEATRGPHMPKILIINSEAFTLWKSHFARLQEVMQTWRESKGDGSGAGADLLTLVRAVHVSFSDFGVIVPFARRDGRRLMDVVGALAVAFLEDRLEEALKGMRTREMEVAQVKKFHRRLRKVTFGHAKRRLAGDVGDVIVHHP
ncbi:hypothetical protein OBBRIDRAFT_727394 [Obba rivulosa]|uniref:1-alkyl-2-acetylglycerophosphocholine esterase n=1 Tax=Obba rivulosa TaxID=1052685 RepID=A0A8E2B1P5_9APHY|nr:hypothetical protein OBBRIDRAFT_727394 [Obba rivulosa]